jgi:YD repeat-containing protein
MITKLIVISILFAVAAVGQNIAYTYDAAGRLALVDYGNGTQIQYTYDNSGNLLSRTVVAPSPSAAAKSKEKATSPDSAKPMAKPKSSIAIPRPKKDS